MAPHGPQDPLDILQLMVNEVLVQTGKALRASRRDNQGASSSSAAQVKGTLQKKVPETVEAFHSALDQIEHEIIKAKSVLQRDLTELQRQRQPVPTPQPLQQLPQQPEPVEAQSKSPMVIDIDSSSPVNEKQLAPFPDMGMGLPDDVNQPVVIKDDPSPLIPVTTLPHQTTVKTEAPMAPMPLMDHPMGDSMSDAVSNSVGNSMGNTMSNSISNSMSAGPDIPIPSSELNFTNMEFTLAQPNGDGQVPTTTQEPSFDLTTFAPTDGDNDLSVLDNLLAENPTEQTHTSTSAPLEQPAPLPQPKQEEVQDDKMASAFDDILSMDSGNYNGSLEDTFNDLMNDRDDNTFSFMEHGEFDNAYFGLGTDSIS